ncbi:MAG TPA: phosphoenolpyruvate kinase [Thermoanaerobaculia bacterium]|nr:phosphoenolpyruvate kinase [Thermoanaerobaculia bacterium]
MTLTDRETATITSALEKPLAELAARFPGESDRRQPVHTVYGGAHLFKSDTAPKLGALALRALDENAPDAATFAKAIGLPAAHAQTIHARVIEKLKREPVEDFRIDFEDGYGNRPDDEEDHHAELAAREIAAGMRNRTLPPCIGIRIKPFSQELTRRSLRTVDIFLGTLMNDAGKLPPWFVVTLPKIQRVEQVTALANLFDLLEPKLSLAPGTLKFEFMIETTQSIPILAPMLDAGRGRVVAAHFGTYDYTASCNITAAEQRMDHPACDFARHNMQVAYSGTGIWLSDGATNVMPIGDRETVHRAWRLHVEHIQHSLVNGFYQGWDLNPAQLPTRYAAVFSFFLEGLGPATDRLRNFIQKAGQATLVGDVFDDAATGQGLLNYFLRALNCGAITEQEALATGLTLDELRSRSFVRILRGRRAASVR